MDVLGEFENFLHDVTLPGLVHIALCHYQFEAIHPFLDGNGRVGRLLIALLLLERQILPTPLLPTPLLYMSAFFEATVSDYYSQLYNVSAYSTWNDWLLYFLHGVAAQSKDLLSRSERINALIAQWRDEVGAAGSGAIGKIVAHCAINPFFTLTKISRSLDVAYTTAQRAASKLESLGIISQINQGKRDRLYCATRILAILDEPQQLDIR